MVRYCAAAETDDGRLHRAVAAADHDFHRTRHGDHEAIATPTIGGMISSTVYVLFLIPCLFAIGEDIRACAARNRRSPAPTRFPRAKPMRYGNHCLTMLGVFAALAVSSAQAAAAPAPAPAPANVEALFPPGPEKTFILDECQNCHTLNMVAKSGASEAGWNDRLVRMIRAGASIPRGRYRRSPPISPRRFPSARGRKLRPRVIADLSARRIRSDGLRAACPTINPILCFLVGLRLTGAIHGHLRQAIFAHLL